jgi:hypothetical protein
LAQTFAVPPNMARSASRSSTGAADPNKYLSSISSPSTIMRQLVKSKWFLAPRIGTVYFTVRLMDNVYGARSPVILEHKPPVD